MSHVMGSPSRTRMYRRSFPKVAYLPTKVKRQFIPCQTVEAGTSADRSRCRPRPKRSSIQEHLTPCCLFIWRKSASC
ncbi:hypothetical protein SKAU_G00004520 [Synaphobranchus kaupii]|uniref:Uncharacterized protein n=1 Tax=Synaphobranchus kaupii TaxID=118154 RepID=A0A9Q1GA09_SYNKA|nr:hypothetical protein SKAU_G00004520 [Synaphobranchus kaupii]